MRTKYLEIANFNTMITNRSEWPAECKASANSGCEWVNIFIPQLSQTLKLRVALTQSHFFYWIRDKNDAILLWVSFREPSPQATYCNRVEACCGYESFPNKCIAGTVSQLANRLAEDDARLAVSLFFHRLNARRHISGGHAAEDQHVCGAPSLMRLIIHCWTAAPW